jgi:hypothetical protein
VPPLTPPDCSLVNHVRVTGYPVQEGDRSHDRASAAPGTDRRHAGDCRDISRFLARNRRSRAATLQG